MLVPGLRPLGLRSFPSTRSPSHCLKPKQPLRSATYTCDKHHGLNNNTGRHLYELQPKVLRMAYRGLCGGRAESKVGGVKVGRGLLGQHLRRVSVVDSPACGCGAGRWAPGRTVFHRQDGAALVWEMCSLILWGCSLLHLGRQPLMESLVSRRCWAAARACRRGRSHKSQQLLIHSSTALSLASKVHNPSQPHRVLHRVLILRNN